MVSLYVVRHGETQFNKYRRIQGWSDSPLTESGVDIAKKLGIGLKNIYFDVAYSSDSNRARYTRDYILEAFQTPPITKEKKDLREMAFGIYEGEKITNIWPIINNEDTSKLPFTQRLSMIEEHEGVEGMHNFENRIKTTFINIVKEARKERHSSVLIVTHGAVISTLVRLIDPSLLTQSIVHNASVTKINIIKDAPVIEYFNNTSFLP